MWSPFSKSGKRLRAAFGPSEAPADPAELRDDAESILRSTVLDMQSDQTRRTAGREVERCRRRGERAKRHWAGILISRESDGWRRGSI